MLKTMVNETSYRLIPSHFTPVSIFENLLDPSKLEAAYALESITNDRLQDEVGNIAFVSPEDRITGQGTTAIMAAFTHIGVESRFTEGRYGVYYAGLDLPTAIAESRYSWARFMWATDEAPTVLTMGCYQCMANGEFVDLLNDPDAQSSDKFAYSQKLGRNIRSADEIGVLYRSLRRPEGLCIATFRPIALLPPAFQTGHYQFHWNGQSIEHVLSVSDTS